MTRRRVFPVIYGDGDSTEELMLTWSQDYWQGMQPLYSLEYRLAAIGVITGQVH